MVCVRAAMAEQSAGAGTEVAWPAKPRLLLRPVAEEAPAANSRAPAFGFLPSDEEEANEPDIWNAQTRSINRCFYSSQKQRENCTDAALSTQKSHPPRERQRRHTHFADQETEAQEGHSPKVTPLESGGAGGWSQGRCSVSLGLGFPSAR